MSATDIRAALLALRDRTLSPIVRARLCEPSWFAYIELSARSLATKHGWPPSSCIATALARSSRLEHCPLAVATGGLICEM